jgi:hypothetical protein
MTTTMGEKRELMLAYAVAYAADQTEQRARDLAMSAWEYAEARRLLASGATAAAASIEGPVVPFGKDKGKPLPAVSKNSLEWLMGAVEHSIGNPDKARFIESNQQMLEALKKEYAGRK